MAQKLNCIFLIDDDEPTNFLHKIVIDRLACAEKVMSFTDARQALKMLTNSVDGAYIQPDLIFLDINMPGMNGWEFMHAYEQLPKDQRGNIVVMMLTTSLNPDDRAQADSLQEVSKFLTKPLTKDLLKTVLEEHFGW